MDLITNSDLVEPTPIAEVNSLGAAEALKALLEGEGVSAKVQVTATVGAAPTRARVLVSAAMAHRARWVLDGSEFSEAELTYLAIGELPLLPIDWGQRWEPVEGGFDDQLDREIKPGHPLHGLEPRSVGRCRACDDVVVRLRCAAGEPELAVVHLTWNRVSPPPWPWSERMTLAEFERRFLRGDEHL